MQLTKVPNFEDAIKRKSTVKEFSHKAVMQPLLRTGFKGLTGTMATALRLKTLWYLQLLWTSV